MLLPNASNFDNASQSSQGFDFLLVDSLSQVNQRVSQSVLGHGRTSLASTADIGKLVKGRSTKAFIRLVDSRSWLHMNNSIAVLFGQIFSNVGLLFWSAIHFIEVNLVEDTFEDVPLKVFTV